MLLSNPHCGAVIHRTHQRNSSSVDNVVHLASIHRRASGLAVSSAVAEYSSKWAVAYTAAQQHRVPRHITHAATNEPTQGLDEVEAETKARLGWDPAGVLPSLEQIGTTDHFARRARQRQQQQQQQQTTTAPSSDSNGDSPHAPVAAPAAYSTAVRTPEQTQQQQQQQQTSSAPAAVAEQPAPPSAASAQPKVQGTATAAALAVPPAAAFRNTDPYERIPAKWLAQGGIPASETSAYDRPAFIAKLAEKFIPINLDYPGVRIVNFDPAIFTVEGFMTPEECNDWQQQALESGCLQQSKIGGGNAGTAAGGGVNVYGSRRTSSSLLMDPHTQAQSPGLTALMHSMQSRGQQLLAHLDGARSWGPAGKMPVGGQYCYEHPQVARYLPGQHFLAHEDAFPALLATANCFQRHATLLLYLNDVQQGGATHFDHLGISVQPKQGMALLFFPAYANGTADPRSLHTAQDAVDTKWVMQQWIARGYPVPKAVLKAVNRAATAGPEVTAAAVEQPIREVFRVPISSSSSSSSSGNGGSSKRNKKGSKKAGGGQKGFSKR